MRTPDASRTRPPSRALRSCEGWKSSATSIDDQSSAVEPEASSAAISPGVRALYVSIRVIFPIYKYSVLA